MSKRSKILSIIVAALLVMGGAAYFSQDWLKSRFFSPTGTKLEEGVRSGPDSLPEVIAQDLTVPWEVAFLPDGDALITERSGTLKRVGVKGSNEQKTYKVEGVEHVGEGGLMGLALHPDFETNGWLYLYLTSRSGEGLVNRVERYRFDQDRLSQKTTIIDNIPGAANHDGGRIAFGPDKLLYITTGDAGQPELAQNTGSLAGKILRLEGSGKVPPGNPFGNAVYSYGHRNPQGLAWDGQGRLWATEHGRSGAQSGFDELNLIKAGTNYGWPLVQGDETRSGLEPPVAHSGGDETWAPAGMAFWGGSLFFAGLRGQALYEAKINGDKVALKSHYRGDFGRLRAVALGPENFLYVSTSNTDGRGNRQPSDDKLIRLSPEVFRD